MKASYVLCFIMLLSGCVRLTPFDVNNASTVPSESERVDTLMAQASMAIENDNIEAAMEHYKAMQLAGVQSPITLNQLAVALRGSWYLDQAEAVYLDALELSPKYPLTHWNLGIYYELYRGKFDQALTHYRSYQTLSAQPDMRIVGWISQLERRLNTE